MAAYSSFHFLYRYRAAGFLCVAGGFGVAFTRNAPSSIVMTNGFGM